MKQLYALFLGVAISQFGFAASTASPSSVKITVYAVAVSKNADCSSATAVSTFSGGKEFDFMQNPTLMTGNLADGSYPCVILQMSDKIKLIPAANTDDNVCVAGTEYTQSVCEPDNQQKYSPMTVNSDNTVTFGTATACAGNEVVPLFLSTTSTSTSNNLHAPFEQPVDANKTDCTNSVATGCGANLSSAFVVSGTTTGTFVVDFTDAVDVQNGACSVEAPLFGFR